MSTPRTRDTDVKGARLAYQVFGEGPQDLLIVPGVFSHLDLAWTDPGITHFMRRLGAFARVITYDRMGVGLSDPVASYPTLDDRLDEISAVLAAAGSTSVHVLGYSEGGAFAGYFAAAYPERIKTITFCMPWVRGPRDDPAEGLNPAAIARLDGMWNRWGSGDSVSIMLPSWDDVPLAKQTGGTWERLVAAPGIAKAIFESAMRTDVSAILPHIRVPSLVIGVTDDPVSPIEHVRAIAAAIPGSSLFELAGRDHSPWTTAQDPMLDEIERFVAGHVADADVDRMLATVVFTDIVGSTQRLAEIGDREWRKLVELHDACVRRALVEYGGREVKTLGDGFLMTFTAPHSALTALLDIKQELHELGLEIRAGMHTGDVEIAGFDLSGMTVNTASRISSIAKAGEVLVSETVRDLLYPTGTVCTGRGNHELKGVPGKHQLYAAEEPTRIAIADDERTVKVRDRLLLAMARRAPGLARSVNSALLRRVRSAAA